MLHIVDICQLFLCSPSEQTAFAVGDIGDRLATITFSVSSDFERQGMKIRGLDNFLDCAKEYDTKDEFWPKN